MIASLFLLAGSVAAAADTGAAGLADFEAGVRSYRAGDFEPALDSFLAAQRLGLEIPNLYVNLGLAYYRLGRYAESQKSFEELHRFPGYEGVAKLHLGLIAARLGDRERAAILWKSLGRNAPQAALRDRAEIALGRLGNEFATQKPSAYVLVAVGYDSKPALLNDRVLPEGDAPSGDAELYGSFDYPLGGSSKALSRLRGGVYAKEYLSEGGPDQGGVFVGLARGVAKASGSRGAAIDISSSQLDGEHLSDSFSASFYRSPAGAKSGVGLRAELSRITAPARFSYLEGLRLRADLELRGQTDRSHWRAGYQFEYNDRSDLRNGDEFFSQSPARHRVGLALEQVFSDRWAAQQYVRYRYSTYRDPDRFMDGNTLREQRRTEGLFQAAMQLRRRQGVDSNLLLEYQFSQNTASLDGFAYNRHLLLLGYEWLYSGR